jgi:hypothetical protein
MEKLNARKERRRSRRRALGLPVDYRIMDASYPHGGLVVNASESGLLVQSVRSIPIGSRLKVAVLFPKGFELSNVEVLAEIIWKDLHWEEDWEGYQYGLKFIQVLDHEYGKLKQLLDDLFHPEELQWNYR